MRLKEVKSGDKLAKNLSAVDPLNTAFPLQRCWKNLTKLSVKGFDSNLQTLDLSRALSQRLKLWLWHPPPYGHP